MSLKLSVILLALAARAALAQPSLDNLLSPSRLPYLKDSRLIQISSSDTTGGNDDYIRIPEGATVPIADIRGPGVVTMIWATIASSDRYFLRRILLRMYWDGEQSPSVEVPIGDFFGCGFEYRQHITPFVGMSSGGYYSYFPMPFNTGARIEIVNETGRDIGSFYYHIDYQKLAAPFDSSVARFHASWHRDIRTRPDRYFTLLEAEGEGHLVGVSLNMQSYDGGLGFLEGDEMIYVDGEKEASIKGTGTEDYFNSGWYFNRGEFSAPYHGLVLKDDSLGRIAAYRFHILDVIPFKKSIRALIEHGDRNVEVADYSCTAYWYQKEPHRPFERIMPASLRIPLRVAVPNGAIEAEGLTLRETSLAGVVEDMSASGPDWSGMKQLKIAAAGKGDRFTQSLPAGEERYDVDLYFTRGPDYGDVRVLSGRRTIGAFKGFDGTVQPGGRITLADLAPASGEITLEFEVQGKDVRSSGFAVGLDAFAMRPRREYIPAWNIIGPFPNLRDSALRRLGLDSAYAPELKVDLAKRYAGANGRTIAWQIVKTPPSGQVDLSIFDPNDLVVAYAFTYVYSPGDRTAQLLLGSDDGEKVFLNGTQIHRVLTIRGAAPDQEKIPLTLHRGWNSLLLKIENNFGGYDFYARIPDPGKSLRYNAQRPE